MKLQKFFPSLTKIVGTLGSSSRSVETIEACLTAGMSGLFYVFLYILERVCYVCPIKVSETVFFFVPQVARFDFSWLTAEYHQETLDNLKKAVSNVKKPCAVSRYLTISFYIFDKIVKSVKTIFVMIIYSMQQNLFR